ncbi:hypothetical protein BZL30_9255 [Mycobacterium kansasii]|uniref:Uncharacterized protein n=1 Tax=Mycobacterium kansasii TaxID=1768 RepID=A0A1V3WBG3_MYCKA|nr:hypothetical protein BZL30_9255 [Mycobacterium kansasii]
MPPATSGLPTTGKICTPGTPYRPIAMADAPPPTRLSLGKQRDQSNQRCWHRN